MRIESKTIADELLDGIRLMAIAGFTGWVALTQVAALSAPIAALATAMLVFPGVETKERRQTIAVQFHRPFAAIGMTLTAFLWLLSTTQDTTKVMPSDPLEELIILVGLMVAVSFIVASPFVFAISRLEISKSSDNLWIGRLIDYGISLFCTFLAFVLGTFMLKLSEEIIPPVKIDVDLVVLGVVLVPAIGWMLAYSRRNPRDEAKQATL